MGERPTPPDPPDLPAYVCDPLERQSPADLDAIAAYASALADWKRRRDEESEADAHRRPEDAVSADTLATLEARDISTDPETYDGVPDSGAYVTVKETKPGYRYYYWQWRDGDSWKNEYIAPVEAGSEP